MNIRKNYDTALAQTSHFGFGTSVGFSENQNSGITTPGNVIVERDVSGKPHKGKVFAVIEAHMDDVPLYCSGTCSKFINEGWTGYLIRTVFLLPCPWKSFVKLQTAD
ncbi:hypothetical protein ACFL2X_07795 [Candidatus Latescibacterota bacterium]